TILRPFNTYGPFQKSTGEGGVISIFLRQLLEGVPLTIYGSGRQTRDFLYVQDCAEFISRAGFSKKTNGHILNAGTGVDVSVNHLAKMICTDDKQIVHKVHIHPQSEIMKLVCDQTKSKKMLGWCPQTRLDKGLAETKFWLREQLQKRMIFQKI
ncbi:NAD-dependent epimerase/dehydratase family protein, partial [PVC group bacterium]|nr:NAD-dependent epimerase/dehydratase family protein [PVC group bacterium]